MVSKAKHAGWSGWLARGWSEGCTRRVGALARPLGLVAAAVMLAAGLPAQAFGQLFGGAVGGGGPALVIENARIITMTGPVIERGTIVMQGGRITAMGSEVEIPRRAMRINAEGKTVTPGLIDMSSGLAMEPEAARNTGVRRRAVDGLDPFAELAFDAALRNGVTTVYVGPPSANGFAGTGAVVRLAKREAGGRGEVLEDRFDFVIDMSNGDAIERARAFEEVRGMFRGALNYRDALDEYEEKLEKYTEDLKKYIEEWEKKQAEAEKAKAEGKDAPPAAPARGEGGRGGRGGAGGPGGTGGAGEGEKKDEPKAPERPKKPEPNRDFELLLEVLDGELPVRFRVEKDADVENALELARLFALTVSLDGAGEGWLLAERIDDAGAAVLLGPALGSGLRTSLNEVRRDESGFGALRAAGVRALVGSGGSRTGSGLGTRFVLENAQLTIQNTETNEPAGMAALRLVTVDAARYLGLGGQAGVIRRGGTADLVLWSGDPTSGAAAVEQVYIDGRPAFAARRGGQR